MGLTPRVLLFLLVVLLALPAWAQTTLYCSPSGGGSGADFNNLCTLPNSTNYLASRAAFASVLTELLALAAAWSGYPPVEAMPAVERRAAIEMPCPCPAVYLYDGGRMLLARELDTGTAHGRSILLHELVHHLQAQEGPAEYGTPLWYTREREAYRVQYRYLRATGALAGRRMIGFPREEESK